MAEQAYIVAGKQTGTIPVHISYRIIELFSEGLYSSPHKAIEELVTNAFDAGARMFTLFCRRTVERLIRIFRS